MRLGWIFNFKNSTINTIKNTNYKAPRQLSKTILILTKMHVV